MLTLIRAIPLLVFPALLYAIVGMTMSHDEIAASLASPMFSAILPSGALWVATRGQAFTVLAAGCLFIEIIKSTRPSTVSLIESGLACLAFIVALIFFLLVPQFGTMEFFLIMIMMLLDFMAGVVVMTITARRDTVIS